jgi:hypothetical protein
MATSMTTTTTERQERRAQELAHAAERVQEKYRGMKCELSQVPYTRTFTTGEKKKAMKPFDADINCVAMAKKLFQPDEPTVKAARAVVADIKRVFAGTDVAIGGPKARYLKYTMPHPEGGIRLVKWDCYNEDDPEVQEGTKQAGQEGKYIERMELRLSGLEEELRIAAAAMAAAMPEIRRRAKAVQKELYDPKDYAFDPAKCYAVKWWPVEVGVPNYCLRLDPQVYRRKQEEVAAKFAAACRLKEEEDAKILFRALDTLVERLTGVREGGKAKIFRDETATKLLHHIDAAEQELEETGVGKGPLEQAFKRLKRILGGETTRTLADSLRDNAQYRELVRDGAVSVANALIRHAVPKPKRKVLRRKAQSEQLRSS